MPGTLGTDQKQSTSAQLGSPHVIGFLLLFSFSFCPLDLGCCWALQQDSPNQT